MYTTVTSYIQNSINTATNSLGLNDKKIRNKRLGYIAIGSISILSVACFIQYIRIKSRNQQNSLLNPYFSATYNSARQKFKDASSKIAISKQHSIIIDSSDKLSIDLCYIPSNNINSKHLILHFSGTHGVEGFAGSAIQIYLLKNSIHKIINNNNERPHILFIHSLNPYGMANNRRWNKSNIDLNRNCILIKNTSEDIWNKVRNRDPKQSGYSDFNSIINPKRKPTYFRDDILFWFDSLRIIIKNGLKKLKKIVVEGQYHNKNGLFYGGNKLAIEHEMLTQFLVDESPDIFNINLCDIIEKLTIIDVHTGLGKYSIDTLLINNNCDILSKLFPLYRSKNRILDFNNESFYKNMYKNSYGFTTHQYGYLSLFRNVIDKDILSFAQEFGTYHGIFVFKALRNENMSYWYSTDNDNDNRGRDVKNVFYPQYDPYWKNNVLNSGIYVFNKLVWR